IALGDPYGSQTHADWKSKNHVDVLTRNCDVWIDTDHIIAKGHYQLQHLGLAGLPFPAAAEKPAVTASSRFPARLDAPRFASVPARWTQIGGPHAGKRNAGTRRTRQGAGKISLYPSR